MRILAILFLVGCHTASAPSDLAQAEDLSLGCTPSPMPSGAGCFAVAMNCADDGLTCDGTACTCHTGPTILSTFAQSATTCTSGWDAAWAAGCGFPQ